MDFVLLFLYVLPSYVANSTPVLLGGGIPLDIGKNFFDRRRIFGEGKTVRGFVAGVSAGIIVAALLALYYPIPFFSDTRLQFLGGTMLALGTMVGDTLGSFIKRRIGVGHGKPFFVDTFFFVIVALIFAIPYTNSSFYILPNIGFIVVLTLILHPLTNIFANKVGLKSVPW